LRDEFYTIKVKEIKYNSGDQLFNIDSIQIIPEYDKKIFALKSERQIDRIEGHVPFIKATGFQISATQKLLLQISGVDVSLNLNIFRDKRYPFRNKEKKLPVRFLHSLPFLVQIDSIRLTKSYVAYEEVQEDGNEPGKVFFDKLKGKIYNVSNTSEKEGSMEASAQFMDTGLLKATFTFPVSPDKPYTIKGTLIDFELPAINSMLTTAANAKISEGTLDELKFHFSYNDTRSDGSLELNYTDLKMTSLLKKKENVPNRVLTFLLRLVVKKDMDENLPTDKKTGTVLFYRDKRRSIFNYWWKSVLSGVKSVYNLDKITNTQGKKK
jgi:hypothetical protein